MKAINIKEKFIKFSKKWHPHQIAVVGDMQVILAKLKGEFVWHSHDDEDELFQVIKGTLYMQFRDRTEVINEGEFIVVPKGVEHNPWHISVTNRMPAFTKNDIRPTSLGKSS